MYYIKQVIYYLFIFFGGGGGGGGGYYYIMCLCIFIVCLDCCVETKNSIFFPGNVFASCRTAFNNVQY